MAPDKFFIVYKSSKEKIWTVKKDIKNITNKTNNETAPTL